MAVTRDRVFRNVVKVHTAGPLLWHASLNNKFRRYRWISHHRVLENLDQISSFSESRTVRR